MALVETEGALAIGAALAVFGGALGTGWAQAAIGSSIMGVIAEKPEEMFRLIVYMAIPELILLLGFVVAFLLMGKMTGAEAAAV